VRILLINWARLPDGPLDGGGVNGYCGQLARELVARGHDVSYLSSGVAYTRGPQGGLGPCEVRRHPDHNGVRVFEVINSPVVAPGPCQARDPSEEISSRVLEEEVGRFCRLLDPDVVHFHNAEGFSAGCLRAVREGRGERKVFYSLHNYHTVCPQVYLMRRGRVPCRSFEGGHACVGCADVCDPRVERYRRAGIDGAAPFQGVNMPRSSRWPSILGLLRRQVTGEQAITEKSPSLPGRSVAVRKDVLDPWDPPPRIETPVPDQEVLPLDNDPTPDPWDPGAENDYGRRRRVFLSALASCDLVLAVSEFVRRKFQALGLPGRVLRTLHIGTHMTELATGQVGAVSLSSYEPLRLAFIGYHNFFKGLHCLVAALESLPREDLARIDLLVSAKAVEEMLPRLWRLRPRLANLVVEPGYSYEMIPLLLRGRHAGVVPSVWWDNSPQTVLEFLACGIPVVGAAVGGIPDFIEHERNGLLFRANDPQALAGAIARLLRESALFDQLRSGVRPPKSMQEHAREIESLYAETAGGTSEWRRD
jgi:glycosyltransferase involved in cell wall biosynthesis